MPPLSFCFVANIHKLVETAVTIQVEDLRVRNFFV